jgi:hypothetical protein
VDVEAECRVAQKRQPQAGLLLADPAVAGQARTDAAGRQRQDYREKSGVTVGRAELQARAWVWMSGDSEALQPMGVARSEPQASPLLEEQGSAWQQEQPGPKLAALPAQMREQRQLALQVLGSTVLVGQQPAQRTPGALQRPACVQALRAMEHSLEQQQARRKAG